MPLLTALAISIAVLGGIATFLFLGPLAATGIQLWAIFIAWACFYHVGGKEEGILTTIVSMIFGAFCGWIAFMLLTKIPLIPTLGVPLWAAICVAIAIVVLVLAANVKLFSVIPATVYGFASIAAFGAFMPILSADGKTVVEANHLGHILDPSMMNPLLAIAVSAIVGSLFGYVSQKIGMALNASAAQAKTA